MARRQRTSTRLTTQPPIQATDSRMAQRTSVQITIRIQQYMASRNGLQHLEDGAVLTCPRAGEKYAPHSSCPWEVSEISA